jgi:tetratricopeptide (TPR) repeat protein
VPASLVGAGVAQRQDTSADVRRRAFDLAYNLDREPAQDLLREALTRWPDDPALHRSLASLVWLEILFRRGSVTVEDALGAVTRRNPTLPPPPKELAAAFEQHAQRAVAIAQQQLTRDPRDVEALYEKGAAEGLLVSYKATVVGKVLEALGDARGAFNAHERVLSLAPQRKDAALVVGTYRYAVASLALPLRLMAYIVGFGGGRERGLSMIEEAAAFESDAQPEARFALVILYNRERRYTEALAILDLLRTAYPRNRLLWLESGATALRAGQAAVALQLLDEGFARFEADGRAKAFGEQALWRHKRGVARARLERPAEAEGELRAAIAGEAREWVRGRSHLELGRLALAAGDPTAARAEFERAATLCERDNDSEGAALARRLRDQRSAP